MVLDPGFDVRRRAERTGAAVIALFVLSATSFGAAATPSAGAATPTPRIRLVSQNPWVGATGTVVAKVRLTGLGSNATLTPRLYDEVRTRSAFELTTRGRDLTGRLIDLKTHRLSGPTATVTVRFQVTDGSEPTPDDAAGDVVTLTTPGVHPLEFVVDDGSGNEVASMVSYVIRLPDAPTQGTGGRQPLRVASEFRLLPRPTSDRHGALTVPESTRRATRSLISGLASSHGAVRSSLGFAISPALVEALASGQEEDRRLLDGLAELTEGRPVQQLAWSPVDLARWLATPELAPELAASSKRGTDVLRTRLHTPDPEVADLDAWGPNQNEQSLRWLADQGAKVALVPAGAMTALDTRDFPRSLASPFSLDIGNGRTIEAMQLDSDLAAHFGAEDPVLGANQLVADLSVMALDLPSVSRGVVVAPPAGWTPSEAFLRAYVRDLAGAAPAGSGALVAPTSLDDLVADTPPARAAGDTETQGPRLVRTLQHDTDVTPLSELGDNFAETSGKIRSLATMQPGGPTRAPALIARLDRQLRLALMPGLDSNDRRSRFAAIAGTIDRTAASPRLPARQTITLTADTASLPITIRRPADGPRVVRVHVDARSRLSFPDGISQIVHLDDDTTHFSVRVHSDSPGDEIVRLTFTSPDNALVTGTTEMVVRSTAASGVGLVISFGSLAFLVLWWARDIVRRRRRRRAAHIPPADLIDVGE